MSQVHMMKRNKLFVSVCLLLAATAAFPITSADLRAKVAEATREFKDITLSCKILRANLPELRKIGKDFAKSYEFKSTNVSFKFPDKMMIEGKLGMLGVRLVMNRDKKVFSIPSLHYSTTEDIRNDPHKRQTDFDIGIVSDSLWRDYEIQGVEGEKNSDNLVYKITFVRENARRKKLVAWVDASSLKLLKVEKFESDGSIISRFIYANHQLVGGVWVPRRVDVYNEDGKLAGTTSYENIKVNTGLSDSAFKP